MKKRILDIVDMQNDFMNPKGALYVPDAENIVAPANKFLSEVSKGDFDFALLKFDTHFHETYDQNPESKQFPKHCMHGEWGWTLAIDPPRSFFKNVPIYVMDKNVFDMWAEKPEIKDISFKSKFNEIAYKNLFKVTAWVDFENKTFGRDKFLKDMKVGKGTEVVMMGVASDYCVHDAMLGYLNRGINVTVLCDLVRGIGTEVDGRAPSGKIEDVIKLPAFDKYVTNGQLRIITSDQLLKEIKAERQNDKRNHCNRPDQPKRR